MFTASGLRFLETYRGYAQLVIMPCALFRAFSADIAHLCDPCFAISSYFVSQPKTVTLYCGFNLSNFGIWSIVIGRSNSWRPLKLSIKRLYVDIVS